MDSHPLIYGEESAKGTGFEFQKGLSQRWRLKTNRATSSDVLVIVMVTDTAGIVAGMGPAPEAPKWMQCLLFSIPLCHYCCCFKFLGL